MGPACVPPVGPAAEGVDVQGTLTLGSARCAPATNVAPGANWCVGVLRAAQVVRLPLPRRAAAVCREHEPGARVTVTRQPSSWRCLLRQPQPLLHPPRVGPLPAAFASLCLAHLARRAVMRSTRCSTSPPRTAATRLRRVRRCRWRWRCSGAPTPPARASWALPTASAPWTAARTWTAPARRSRASSTRWVRAGEEEDPGGGQVAPTPCGAAGRLNGQGGA